MKVLQLQGDKTVLELDLQVQNIDRDSEKYVTVYLDKGVYVILDQEEIGSLVDMYITGR